MKALTVLQPWAQLLMLGVKRYETRSWKTKHRGPLLIHAGRALSETTRVLCGAEPFRGALAQAGIRGPGDLPRGVFLGAVILEDCLPTDQVLFDSADQQQAAFGDFGPGRWAWRVMTPMLFREPIAFRGRRCIFDVPDEICSTLMPATTR
jgi:activating signal cointegrator 1